MVLFRRRRGDADRTLVCPECGAERARLYASTGLDLGRVLVRLDAGPIGRRTNHACRLCGATLADIVADGLPGCCLCYSRFAGEIEQAIRSTQGRTRHVGKAPGDRHSTSVDSHSERNDVSGVPEWAAGGGPDADVVISTRARLARSLAGYPFPPRASREDLGAVAREARTACVGLSLRFPALRSVRVERLSPEQKSFLLDSRAASPEQVKGGEGRLVVIEPSGVLSIMVNEEDHLRLQVIKSGLAPREALAVADWADSVLSERLEYGYSARYGYLTASVSNLGTGLRVSAMMHLAGLAMKRQLAERLRAACDLGVSVRGTFGEVSRAVGDLYQVSNEVTLGVGEDQIVEKVGAVAEYLLGEERRARKELLGEERKRLIERASRSLRVLSSAMGVKSEQALTLMSPLRLAAAEGLVENCPVSLLNELLIGMQIGAGDDGAANIRRASMLRSRLAAVRM
jgi:protein arginine kinase